MRSRHSPHATVGFGGCPDEGSPRVSAATQADFEWMQQWIDDRGFHRGQTEVSMSFAEMQLFDRVLGAARSAAAMREALEHYADRIAAWARHGAPDERELDRTAAEIRAALAAGGVPQEEEQGKDLS